MAGDISGLPGRLRDASEALEDTTGVDKAAAGLILAAALPHTPRYSGALANTGRLETTPGPGVSVVFGGGPVDYAAAVHAANPWLAAATEATTDAVVDAYTDHLTDALDLI